MCAHAHGGGVARATVSTRPRAHDQAVEIDSTPTKERAMKQHSSVRKLLASVALTAGLIGVAAVPASATTSSSSGTFTASGTCNSYYHRLSMGGHLQLSNRYPNGQWVTSRYALTKVNASGAATSAATYTPFVNSFAKPGIVHVPYTTLGGAEWVGQYTDLPTVTYNNIWGLYRIQMQVGVWNGQAYEYAPWDTVSSYGIFNQWGGLAQSSLCIASVT
jgi:hypothetical protein